MSSMVLKTSVRCMPESTLHVTRGHQLLLTVTAHVGLYYDFLSCHGLSHPFYGLIRTASSGHGRTMVLTKE
jgi:hypothetical protein